MIKHDRGHQRMTAHRGCAATRPRGCDANLRALILSVGVNGDTPSDGSPFKLCATRIARSARAWTNQIPLLFPLMICMARSARRPRLFLLMSDGAGRLL